LGSYANLSTNGWIQKNPFIEYKSKIVEVERAFLSQKEIEIMFNKVFATDRLNHVKTFFFSAIVTGLAYAKVKKLLYKNIGYGVDGEKWIYINGTKSGQKV
jgi:hypothetical protein